MALSVTLSRAWAARSCWSATPSRRQSLQRHEPGVYRDADADGGAGDAPLRLVRDGSFNC
ncbi:MAG: hypothetical protein ACLTYN_09450 [Dysosmobacter welbionis]